MFGSRKSISGKYSIFRKCYFPKRKTFSCVWMSQNSFYGKLIPVFGSFKYFYRKCIKSGKRNQNPAKENESTTSDERCDERRAVRWATSDERRAVRLSSDERCDCRSTSALVGRAPLIDPAARRLTSDAIVRMIAPRDLVDRAQIGRASCRERV